MKELYARYRVTPGRSFRLSAVDPEETPGVDKTAARERLKVDLGRLSTLQERLYAEAGQSLSLMQPPHCPVAMLHTGLEPVQRLVSAAVH